MQGVRDYIKFLKRGYGRTTHLVSIDIRNGRMDRETAADLVAKYDGVRPAALDLFLEFLGIDENRFMELIEPHVVAPHVMPSCEQCQTCRPNKLVPDFDRWPRVTGDADRDRRLNETVGRALAEMPLRP